MTKKNKTQILVGVAITVIGFVVLAFLNWSYSSIKDIKKTLDQVEHNKQQINYIKRNYKRK